MACIHAAREGQKLTFCGRKSGYMVFYGEQVTCRKCLGGLWRRPEVADLHCMRCCGWGYVFGVDDARESCAGCEGKGFLSAEVIKAKFYPYERKKKCRTNESSVESSTVPSETSSSIPSTESSDASGSNGPAVESQTSPSVDTSDGGEAALTSATCS